MDNEGTAPQNEAAAELARLQNISQEILAEEGGDGEADSGSFGGGKPSETTTNPGTTGASGEPDEGTADEGDGGGRGTEKAPKWAQAMPESLRGRLREFNEDEVRYLQEVAESGLRQAEFSRLTQRLPNEQQLQEMERSYRAMQAIQADPEGAIAYLQRQMGRNGKGGSSEGEGDTPSSIDELAASLQEQTDSKEFAGTLKRILDLHGQSVRESLKQEASSTPSAKANRVNAAAAEVRKEQYPDLDDETWAKACSNFQEACEARGADWRDVNPAHLDFLLDPYVKLAQAQASKSPQPKPEPPVQTRAAALPPSQSGAATQKRTPWDREGREPSEDEVFQATLAKFGLTEQELARLRAGS